MNIKKSVLGVSAALVLAGAVAVQADSNPFAGRWALTLPDGSAGWLEVSESNGYLDGSMLWSVASVFPLDSVTVSEVRGKDTLILTRVHKVDRKDAQGKTVRTQRYTETIMATRNGNNLDLIQINPDRNGKGIKTATFIGKLMDPIPAAPDLSKCKMGDPIPLFNGKDLTGWRLTDENAANGWFAQDGMLCCDPKQEDGKPHKNYGNLRTDAEFEDFNLKLSARFGKGGNSGIYLRGIYEVQVADTYGHTADPHNMGALYSRITPSASVERPAGEWQDYDITLCDKHLTVILNGHKIIDNQPVLGCTGGALWSDDNRPGPIYLQGDHTGVVYKNIMLRPIIK